LKIDGHTEVYEPGIATTVLEWENIKIFVRQNETLNMDYTVGFYPDLVVVKGEESEFLTQTVVSKSTENFFYDSVTRVAIGLVTKKISPKQHRPYLASLPIRLTDKPIIDSLPLPEYRLLVLSKLWGAIHFFTSKTDSTRPKTELLDLFIPKFLKASTELDYSLTISQFINEIRDFEGDDSPLKSYLESFIPLHLTEDRVKVLSGLNEPQLDTNSLEDPHSKKIIEENEIK